MIFYSCHFIDCEKTNQRLSIAGKKHEFQDHNIKILLMLAIVLLTFFGFTMTSYSQTCGLSFPSGSTINFSNLDKDEISNEVTLTIQNDGDTTATVSVSAKNWKDSHGVVHIGGQFTRFATTDLGASTVYTDKTPLNNTDGEILMGTITSSNNNVTYWQLKADLQNLPFSGLLTQEITFTSAC